MRAVHFVDTNRRRIAVLAGGDSHEREISLKSGQAVAGALATRPRGRCLDPALTPPEAAHFRDVDIAFLRFTAARVKTEESRRSSIA